MDPSTIPEDIYALLDDDNHHVANEENVQAAGEALKDLLRQRLTKREAKKGEDVLRFSAIGKKDRQIWYDANEPEAAEKMGGKTNFKFLYGDVIELLLLFLAAEAGHSVTDQQKEVEVDGVKGHIDAVIDGVLVDVKSASSYSFDKFKSGGYLFDDPFGYVSQLSGYAHSTGLRRAAFLVADKVHGDIAFVELDEEYVKGNPPKERIAHLKEVINQKEPPKRCYSDIPEGKSGNRKLAMPCGYCKHKHSCWADANDGSGLRKFVYSRGPVWMTTVKKEPRVGEADD